ncbi:MAG: hypothetical protein HC925_01490 [Coleofasciculaceae cyanobacterium SM2_3_26]|nr:hypothetical protein [Coleofasciculaceae cyanobacterium SM2_3_26]
MFFAKTDNSAGAATISAGSLQDRLAGQLMGLFDKAIEDRKQYYMKNQNKIPIKKDVAAIINSYATNNTKISGVAGLVPGALGMLSAIPEIVAVTRNQIAMIYDISIAYGHYKVLNKELLVGILGYAMGAGAFGLLSIHGRKILIKRASLRMMQKLAQLFAGKISQRLLKSMVGKWVPFAGAAALAAWSNYSTRQIGKKAVEILEHKIELDNEIVDTQQFAEKMDRVSDSQANIDLEILKVQSLINLMLVDGRIADEE